jgi:hypothetical protein
VPTTPKCQVSASLDLLP